MGDKDKEEAWYESLQKEVAGVLSQLRNDPNMETFRTEYEKLHTALVKTHDSEKVWIVNRTFVCCCV